MSTTNTNNDNIFSSVNGGGDGVTTEEPSFAPSMIAITTKEPSIALGGVWGDEKGNYEWVSEPVSKHGHSNPTFERNTFPPFTMPPGSRAAASVAIGNYYFLVILWIILVLVLFK